MSDLCFDDIDQNCDECYELTQEDCLPEVIQAGLTPAASYWLWCVAPDGNIYKDQITIAGDGSFTIDVDSGAYPTGLFNKYAGKFEFFLSTSQTDSTPVAFSISAVSYNCLIMNWTVNCCDNTYVPPTDCEKLLDTLSEDELNTCILPTYDFSDAVNVQPNVTAQQQSDLIDWLCVCPSQSGIAYKRPILTAQTTSYRTYDDGWNLANGVYDYTPPVYPINHAQLDTTSLTPFLTLKENNAFGNKNRFTDDTGAQTYANDYVIDHLTGLGWYRVRITPNETWNDAVDNSQASTAVSLSGWRLPNKNEYESIMDDEQSQTLNYLPFSIAITTDDFWTSTTVKTSTTTAYLVKNVGIITNKAKTGTDSYLICRNHYA